MGKKGTVNIYYPKGCVEILSIYKAFNEVYSKELSYKIKLAEIDNPRTFQKKSIKIRPFKVNHREPGSKPGETIEVPSLGFKFYYDNKSICYGGDTAYCDSLVKMAKDSDLAIIEAGAENKDTSNIHMTFDQAVEIGETAKEYFLVHVPE